MHILTYTFCAGETQGAHLVRRCHHIHSPGQSACKQPHHAHSQLSHFSHFCSLKYSSPAGMTICLDQDSNKVLSCLTTVNESGHGKMHPHPYPHVLYILAIQLPSQCICRMNCSHSGRMLACLHNLCIATKQCLQNVGTKPDRCFFAGWCSSTECRLSCRSLGAWNWPSCSAPGL